MAEFKRLSDRGGRRAVHQVSEVLKALYGRNWANNIWTDVLA